MTRCGMPARFPRTGSACWKETSPKRSFRGFWEKHGPGSCSVTNTSRWMEHCWKLGRRTKASGQAILWARITTRSRNHQREFVEELRCMGVTPHVAQNQGRRRVKRHLVCKRWTIEKADENSNGIPWFVLHRPNSDKLRFHLPSLPWHWFDA